MVSIIKIIYFLYLLIKKKPENLKLEDRDYIMYFIVFSYFKFYVQKVKGIFIIHGNIHFVSIGHNYKFREHNGERENVYIHI